MWFDHLGRNGKIQAMLLHKEIFWVDGVTRGFFGSVLSLFLSIRYFQFALGVSHLCGKIWKAHAKQCKGNFTTRIKQLVNAV